jgi:hypothetical protein
MTQRFSLRLHHILQIIVLRWVLAYDKGHTKLPKSRLRPPASFGIMSIPTLLLKKDGEVVEKAVGVHTKDQLQAMIAKKRQSLMISLQTESDYS